ncbi:hypothetical protein [Nocardia sp. NPDC058666]|uniref:hypothetical protein n=1 Tax=unclassified Nocardia TaxID=2637762 RepID=UPI00364D1D1F
MNTRALTTTLAAFAAIAALTSGPATAADGSTDVLAGVLNSGTGQAVMGGSAGAEQVVTGSTGMSAAVFCPLMALTGRNCNNSIPDPGA